MASDSKRKSVDDISLKYAEDRFGLDSNEIYICATSHHDGYTQGRADALRWIPVSERQPEKSGKYLVSIFEGDCGSSLDYTAEQKGWNLNWLTGSREHEMFPTHWMELPLAPIKLPGGEND